jgi:hypothetical protein
VIKADGRWSGVPEGEHIISISKIVKAADQPEAPQSMFSPEGRKYMSRLPKGPKKRLPLNFPKLIIPNFGLK